MAVRRIILPIIGFAFIMLSYITIGQPQNKMASEFSDRPSTEKYLVKVRVGNLPLNIPRNYLWSVSKISDGKVEIFAEAIFPGFAGAEQSNIEEFYSRNRYNYKDIVILYSQSNYHSAFAQNTKIVMNRMSREGGKKYLYDLLHIDDKMGGIYYVGHADSEENAILIHCFRVDKNDRCEVSFDLAPGAVFAYQYDISLLPEWDKLHNGVKDLLASFVEK